MAEIKRAVAHGQTRQLQHKLEFLSRQTSYTKAELVWLALKCNQTRTGGWLLKALPPNYFDRVELFSVAVHLENLELAQLLWDSIDDRPQGLEIRAVVKFVRMGGNTQPVQIMLKQT